MSKDMYNYYPKITAEKIGTKNSIFYMNCRRENGRAFVENRGTPYRVTDGETTFILYIHKTREHNCYNVTEESTGCALWTGFKTMKEAAAALTGDLNEMKSAGVEITGRTEHISCRWDVLKKGVKSAFEAGYELKYGVNYVVETADGTIKNITDYPAETQEKYFGIALHIAKEREKAARKAEKKKAAEKKPASTPKNARKRAKNEKNTAPVYTDTPETKNAEIDALKAKIENHYTAALEKWRAAKNLKATA